MRKLIQTTWPFFFIFLVVILFFFRLFYPEPRMFVTPDFGQSDLWQLNYPTKFFLSENLKKGKLPLWSKNIGNGFPVLAEGQGGTFNFFNLLLFKVLPWWQAFNLSYPIIFLVSFLGAFFYARILKLNKISSIFSALAFSFSGFFVTHISHLNLIQTASFLPLLFLLTHIFLVRKKVHWGLLLSIVLSQQIFSGFSQITLITLIGVAIYFIFLLFTLKKKKASPLLSVFCYLFFVILAFLFSSIQLFPQKELLDFSPRAGGFSQLQATRFSYPFRHLITFVKPFVLGNPQIGTYPHFEEADGSIFWENTGYLGLLALFFAFLSFSKLKKNPLVRFYWLLALLSLFLMTGKYSPFYFVYSFPPFSYFRVPSRFILLFIWSLVVLSGYGFQVLQETLKKKGFSKTIVSLLSLILIGAEIFDLFSFGRSYNPIAPVKEWLNPPETARFFLKEKKASRIYQIGSGIVWNKEFLKNGWKNPDHFHYFRNSLTPNLNLIFNLSSINSYPALTTRRSDLMSSLIDQGTTSKDGDKILIAPWFSKLLKLYGVEFVISPFKIESEDLIEVFETKNNLSGYPSFKIYSNKEPLPRVFFASEAKTATTVEELKRILISEELDPQKEIILEKEVKHENLPAGRQGIKTKEHENNKIEWIKDEDQEIELNVTIQNSGFLVLADSYYPGWKAFIDGKETEILAANLNQRAIKIEKGTHQVKFIYQSKFFKLGAIVSGLAFLVIIFLVILPPLFSIAHKFFHTPKLFQPL